MTKEAFYSGFIDRTYLSESHDAEYGVYFILDCQGKIKIGKTNNIAKRMTDLQINQPTTLRLAGWISCKENGLPDSDYSRIETMLHHKFDFCHVRGEWFEDLPVLGYLFHTNALLYPFIYAVNSGLKLPTESKEKDKCLRDMKALFWKDYSALFKKDA